MNTNRSERGQALVLIILSIVAIFGFAALAVDMGRIYAERRRAQSAADAAALAAAYSVADYKLLKAPESEILAIVEQTALESVVKNGYDDPNPNVPGDNPDVEIHTPPTHGDFEECDCQYIQVTITSQTAPIFAQFVFSGEEKWTTEAIARGRRSAYFSQGNAIHALSMDPDAVEMDGDTKVYVNGGNIFSNGGGLKHGAAGNIVVKNGNIQIADDWVCTGCKSSTVSGKLLTGVEPLFIPDVPMPYCPVANESVKGVNYYVHNGINSSMKLQKGVHCVTGDIVLNGNDVLTGDGVMLVMLDGGITINGNAKLQLKRPSALKDKLGHDYNGMLIYVVRDNASTIMLGGTADSWFSGTIYGMNATCDIGGTSKTNALHTSVICNKVKFHGTSTVNILFKQPENFQMQPLVELIE